MGDKPKLGPNRGNAGKGRPKGVPNKTTAAFKDAIVAVYADLQATKPGREHGHFFAWADGNQTEFYKLASKLIPIQLAGDDENPIKHVHKIELVAPGHRDG